jgi:hypothetical protein
MLKRVEDAGPAHGTNWQLNPSLKYDALCFLNIATGDPYYLKFYPDAYTQVEPLLTPEARGALAQLKRKIKDEGGSIISAFLALYFSATDAESLDELLAVVDDSEVMRRRLQQTPYYSEGGWQLYESVRGELRTIFAYLQESGFEERWRRELRPVALERIEEIAPDLPAFDVIGEVERVLGRELPSDRITVYMLNYCQPHGIKITGTRFLTDVAWPFNIVVRNAVHEMMHPPYELAADPELREAIDQWRRDEFLMERVLHHNPAFGYNSFEGFVEENIIQAAEQIIVERLGVAMDARGRWKQSDEGMHVLAAALYSSMKSDGALTLGESLREFLIRTVRTGRLGPGRIEGVYREFYAF